MQSYDEKTLSTYALDILNKMANKEIIKYAEEIKTWDGVDEYGPEIIIYDFYVIIDKKILTGNIDFYEYCYYHMEYYTNITNVEYNLEKKEYHTIIEPKLFTS
jgi:hypothetical protein